MNGFPKTRSALPVKLSILFLLFLTFILTLSGCGGGGGSHGPLKHVRALPDIGPVGADTVLETGAGTLYGFAKSSFSGCGLDGTNLPLELYCGIYLEAQGGVLRYRFYSHNGSAPVSAWLARTANGNTRPLEPSESLCEIDLSQEKNSLFTAGVRFDNGNVCQAFVCVNGGEVWTVRISQNRAGDVRERFLDRPEQIRAIAERSGVTPENSLGSTSADIAYPTYAGRGPNNRCDTDLWRNMAHEIVGEERLPASLKLAMLHDWMTANLSYDNYTASTLGMSRSNYYRVWDGRYNVYDTKTGICRDFTNIFAIMARECGVPCSSLETDTHTWSIVWLDGKWQEIDLTPDIQRHVYGEDVTEVTNPDAIIDYGGFFQPQPSNRLEEVISAGYCVYSEKFARTGVH